MSEVNLLGPNLILSDSTPAAPGGSTLVTWQGNGQKISGYVATGTGGTVTSVALTMPAEFSVAGSPVTSAGTLAVTKANESANTVWAGPASGSAAVPAFRALTYQDLPPASPISYTTSGTYTLSMLHSTVNADATAGSITLNLPNPHSTGDQFLISRGDVTTANTVTVAGNGYNIYYRAGGTATTEVLYGGEAIQLYAIGGPSSLDWVILRRMPSAWLPWTPTLTGSGSLTISSPTFSPAEYQVFGDNVTFRLIASFTAAGTGAGLTATLPTTIFGSQYFSFNGMANATGVTTEFLAGLAVSPNMTMYLRGNAMYPAGTVSIYAGGWYRRR